jgi:hypothetical protein
LVLVAATVGCPAAFALEPMGPPRASLEEGQFVFGVDLSYGDADVELTGGTWTNPSVTPTSGTLLDRTVELETTKLYATGGYGFAQNWEAFLGIGAATGEFGDDLWGSGEDFDSEIELGVRGGVRTTILQLPDYDVELGGLIRFNWGSYDGKLDGPTQSRPDLVEIDLLEVQVAVGATYWWKDNTKVYAGPFVHYLKGDLDHVDVAGQFDSKWTIDEGPIWGLYLGALVELPSIAENCVLNIEYQQSSDASVLGAGLMLTY